MTTLPGTFDGLIESRQALAGIRVDRSDESLEQELARNEATLAVLRRLGVDDSDELPLSFVFETGGREADERLAALLEREAGYDVWIEEGGVSGRTTPVELSSVALEEWVRAMLGAGRLFGSCAFGGWTATWRRG